MYIFRNKVNSQIELSIHIPRASKGENLLFAFLFDLWPSIIFATITIYRSITKIQILKTLEKLFQNILENQTSFRLI